MFGGMTIANVSTRLLTCVEQQEVGDGLLGLWVRRAQRSDVYASPRLLGVRAEGPQGADVSEAPAVLCLWRKGPQGDYLPAYPALSWVRSAAAPMSSGTGG